jgi:hypothetical protein
MQTRSTSTELSGGEGFTYEDGVVVYYLAALLHEEAAAGLTGSVARVCVQQKAQGEPLDDVIVDSVADGEERRLSLQVKRSLTISSADQDFKSIIKQAVETRAKLNFRVGADRYGFAVRAVALGRFNSLERIIARANASTNGAEFVARFVAGAESSQDDIDLRNELLTILIPADADSEADFYRHFVALHLNGLDVGGDRYTDLTNRLGHLVQQDQTGAALTAILARHARLGAGYAKVWTRHTLLSDLRQEIRLKVVPSFASDIKSLTNEAEAAVKDIRDDIGGIVIDRSLLADNALAFTEKFKVVNISGLPGCGKSVILRRMVERAISAGPVLFLKSDRLAGTTWLTYAISLRLQHRSLVQLLSEIGSAGTPILFIDGIDRIKTEQRNIVMDILHAIESEPALSHWRVVVSSRDQGLEVFRSWLPASFYRDTGIGDVSVSALDDSETEQLVVGRPALKSLLFGSDAVKEISRRPFFAAVLADKIASGSLDVTAPPQTESELIDVWWRAGGYNADPQQAYLRQRALLDLAETGAPKLGKEVLARRLQATTQPIIPSLQHDHVIMSVQIGTSFSFAHDIFFEWTFFRLLIDKGDQWIDAIKTAGEPPLLARIVSLFSQHLLETNTAWREAFEKLDATTLRPQWRRAWLLGPPSSSRFMEHLPTIEPLLSDNNYEFLKKFLVWFQAERTVPNPLVLSKPQAGLDGQRIIQMADLVGWPSDVRAWQRVIVWLIKREADFPANIMPLIVELLNVWQNMFLDMPNWVSEKVIAITESWLGSFKDRHEGPYAEHQPPSRWDGLDHKTRDALKKTLRGLILRSARSYPEAAKRILHKAISLSRSKRDRSLFDEIVMFAPILATTCPEQLADLVRADVIDVLPKDEIEAEDRKREEHFDRLKVVRAKPVNERTESETRMLAHPTPFIFGQDRYDLDAVGINGHQQAFNPASPLRQPFASLFEHAPDIARRLVRDITNHAVEGWLQVHEINRSRHGGRYGKPLPIELSFPWGTQQFWGRATEYMWFLGQLAPQPIDAGLLALTYWAHRKLDEGRDLDTLLQEVLDGHRSCAVLGLAASLVIEKSHVSFSALPLVTSQRLWHMDIQRQAQGAMPEIDFMGINAHKAIAVLVFAIKFSH